MEKSGLKESLNSIKTYKNFAQHNPWFESATSSKSHFFEPHVRFRNNDDQIRMHCLFMKKE